MRGEQQTKILPFPDPAIHAAVILQALDGDAALALEFYPEYKVWYGESYAEELIRYLMPKAGEC